MKILSVIVVCLVLGAAVADQRVHLHRLRRASVSVGAACSASNKCNQFKPNCCKNGGGATMCSKTPCDPKLYTPEPAGDYVAPAAPQQQAPATKVCEKLCEKKEENTKRYGVEIEMKKWQLPVGGIASQAKLTDCPAGTYDYMVASSGANYNKWYKEKGYKAIYTGKGDWAAWNIHLDGGGRIIEMVTKPGTVAETGAALALMSKTLNDDFSRAKLEGLLFNTANFEPVHTDDSSKKIYCFIEKQLELSNSGSESFEGVIAPKAAQVTTSFTLEEMKANAKVYNHFGKPANDDGVKTFLEKTKFTGAEKPKNILMKHAAEQLMANIPMTVPEPFPFDHKVETAWGMHTQANKLAHLMSRGGKTAFMLEFRGESPVEVEKKIYELMRDKKIAAKDFEDALKMVA